MSDKLVPEFFHHIPGYIARETDKIVQEVKAKGSDSVLNEVIKPLPDLQEIYPYVTCEYWSSTESVNVFSVVGTKNSDFAGKMTWIEVLERGPRIRRNLSLLARNPDYYFESKPKDPVIRYLKINSEVDEIYVEAFGTHRTAIAKVLFTYCCTGCDMIHGVSITEFKVDYEAKNLCERLRKLLIQKRLYLGLSTRQRLIKTVDTPGGLKKYYDLSFVLKNHKKNKEVAFRKSQLPELIREVERLTFWKKVTRRFRMLKEIV